ncbi:MAG: serine hydrolase domain-containing protein [Acidimicrobiales bacterium]
MKAEIDGILRRAVAAGDVPGMVAVVVDAAATRYEGAAGERTVGTGDPMTVDTVGAIYSMTKPLIGVAAMHAVEAGLLELDAPASRVRPELESIEVLDGWDGDGEPILRPPRTAITLRNLLTHTSGFSYDIWNAETQRYVAHSGMPPLSSGRLAALRQPLMFDPGERWEYGIGIDWVGQMIEAVVGCTLSEYVTEHVLEPLGMHDTAFRRVAVPTDRMASMHARLADGSFVAIERQEGTVPEFDEGGGGLVGTMVDYARFLRMVLRGGELDGRRVLAAETVDLMAQNHIGQLQVRRLPTTNPLVSLDAEFFPGTPKRWGLTWQIDEQPQVTGRPAGTLMWAGLSNCFHWIDRRTGIAGCSMIQLLPFVDERALSSYYEVEAAVYAAN